MDLIKNSVIVIVIFLMSINETLIIWNPKCGKIFLVQNNQILLYEIDAIIYKIQNRPGNFGFKSILKGFIQPY